VLPVGRELDATQPPCARSGRVSHLVATALGGRGRQDIHHYAASRGL